MTLLPLQEFLFVYDPQASIPYPQLSKGPFRVVLRHLELQLTLTVRINSLGWLLCDIADSVGFSIQNRTSFVPGVNNLFAYPYNQNYRLDYLREINRIVFYRKIKDGE